MPPIHRRSGRVVPLPTRPISVRHRCARTPNAVSPRLPRHRGPITGAGRRCGAHRLLLQRPHRACVTSRLFEAAPQAHSESGVCPASRFERSRIPGVRCPMIAPTNAPAAVAPPGARSSHAPVTRPTTLPAAPTPPDRSARPARPARPASSASSGTAAHPRCCRAPKAPTGPPSRATTQATSLQPCRDCVP
jgi:hypothetical protein